MHYVLNMKMSDDCHHPLSMYTCVSDLTITFCNCKATCVQLIATKVPVYKYEVPQVYDNVIPWS